MGVIRVLIVDDSAVVRQVLSEILNSAAGIKVIATAADPVIARTRLAKEWPDVIITDIEMPRMNGLEFIEYIMKEKPTPIIVCSSYAGNDARLTMRALSLGAVDIIEKPKVGIKDFLNESVTVLVDSVRSACSVNVKRLSAVQTMEVAPKLTADAILSVPKARNNHSDKSSPIVIIGASAGGTQAIEFLLKNIPQQCPPIVIVQHMPEIFTKAFADRLNQVCSICVREAIDGESLDQGTALIAPGGKHLLITASGERDFSVIIKEGPMVSRHRPSVDVLFRSAAGCVGRNSLGIILTGMGDDGAVGMAEMHNAGITTIAQDEESCAVFGMPKEAIRRGGVDHILPLDKIPAVIAGLSFERLRIG